MTRPLKQTIIGLSLLVFSSGALLAGEIPYEDVWPIPGTAGPRGPGDGVLIDHQPFNSGGGVSDTLFSESPGGTPFPWQLVADSFMVPNSSVVRKVVFWGFYNFGLEPSGIETFRLRFYSSTASDGFPTSVLYEATFDDLPRTWTGRQVIAAGGGRELRFEATLPTSITLDAHMQYWFEVAQIGDLSTAFRWEFSATNPLDGQAIQNPTHLNWVNTFEFGVTVNTAFQLSSVPEPSSGILIFSCAILLSYRKRRRCHK